MIDGTAGAMEPLLWFYSKGRPQDRVEADSSNVVSMLTDDELKSRLAGAAAALDAEK
jgi:hypothetical protein